MRRPLGDVCLDIASFAHERNHEFLSYILRLAAAEAYRNAAEEDAFDIPLRRRAAARELIAGIFDLDLRSDVMHLDAGAAAFFDVDPAKAARGLRNGAYLAVIHPDDVARVKCTLQTAKRQGGAFECEYRLIQHDRLRWVLARGSCTLDGGGRPVRLTGAVIDITHDKAMH